MTSTTTTTTTTQNTTCHVVYVLRSQPGDHRGDQKLIQRKPREELLVPKRRLLHCTLILPPSPATFLRVGSRGSDKLSAQRADRVNVRNLHLPPAADVAHDQLLSGRA